MVVDAARGDQQAATSLSPLLDELEQDANWTALATALRAITDGVTTPDLLADLDQTDTVIVDAILNQLHDTDQAGAASHDEEGTIG